MCVDELLRYEFPTKGGGADGWWPVKEGRHARPQTIDTISGGLCCLYDEPRDGCCSHRSQHWAITERHTGTAK